MSFDCDVNGVSALKRKYENEKLDIPLTHSSLYLIKQGTKIQILFLSTCPQLWLVTQIINY